MIASDIGGIPEQITHGVDGILVPPGDVAALAEAISWLVAGSDAVAPLGAAARATVRDRYSPELHTQALIASYRRAAALE